MLGAARAVRLPDSADLDGDDSAPTAPAASRSSPRCGSAVRRRAWSRAATETELVDAVRRLDAAGEPVLVLGGGSNLLVADEGFAGTVVQVATRGHRPRTSPPAAARCVTVAAGEDWDALVATRSSRSGAGIEALSGIPGLGGGDPDPERRRVRQRGRPDDRDGPHLRPVDRAGPTFSPADCGFGYRTSRFKAEPGRYLVLAVTFQLPLGSLSAPIRYAELARTLGVEVGARVPAPTYAAAVLGLRPARGWCWTPPTTTPGAPARSSPTRSWTPGAAARLPADGAAFPQPDGRVKTSAAWLIEHAGFGKGFGAGPGARLSGKHTLALTNRGAATADDAARAWRGRSAPGCEQSVRHHPGRQNQFWWGVGLMNDLRPFAVWAPTAGDGRARCSGAAPARAVTAASAMEPDDERLVASRRRRWPNRRRGRPLDYGYLIDGSDDRAARPAGSRRQPTGCTGWSRTFDPTA